MRSSKTILFPLFILIFIIQSCDSSILSSSKDDLSKSDSLFLGFHLGMAQKDFFDRCTELNKQQKITQGPGGSTNVEYRIVDEYDSEISMRFFPTFIEEKIFEMPVTYSYIAWAPWNRQYWAENLLPKVLEKYKETYGDDFKLINHPTQGKVYYKIDGKRRINIFIKDEQHVQAVFSDLKVEKRLKEEFEKSQSQEQAPTN
ncbi:hypothetical protein [Cognataquiflexum rubidum]|uniref:hypothetical protein n=1 Tax=Cognataquiflexum rubidum TaxID=2922273 RepID=UPI001F12F1FF|nr:hypothetical protein [Cognataquiflexum rubidum]MCH6236160.1 hypothetical protein [Cognataquiflexum rubidum]